jgi:ubiquinone/menaquinone biosynthesis C-methylase UbiE
MPGKLKEYFDTNRSHWNETVEVHKQSELYSLDEFKKGKNKLHGLERTELGDIEGKSILHLQCHFGMDTLSLEMLGAEVTGVDFSEDAISEAVKLRDEMGMKAEFILSDVYSLPEKLDKKFDMVYTSYGVLLWLNDLDKWGKLISHFLKEDGFFYIAEVHPVSMIFDNETEGINELKVKYSYFYDPVPLKLEDSGDYANRDAKLKNNVTFEWQHSMSDIIMSLINNGLKIEFFREHTFTGWRQFPWMQKNTEGYYILPDAEIPLLFTLKAVKDIK